MEGRYADKEALYNAEGTRLIKSEFIVKLAKAGRPLPRCQALPRGSFLWPSELQEEPERAVLAVSYCWLTPEHPDPQGEQLKTVAEFLGIEQKPWGRPSFTKFAVFFDWGSLPQKPRTDTDEEDFKKGLRNVNLWYAHSETIVVMLTEFPKGWSGVKSYNVRGWPTFEQAVASLIKPFDMLFDLGGMKDCTDFNDLKEKCAKRIRKAPLAPAVFADLLLQQSDGDYKMHFTSGSDRDFVIDKYGETVKQVMASAKTLDYTGLGWHDKSLADLLCCLPFMGPRLQELDLRGNALTLVLDGAGQLCQALLSLPQLQLLELGRNQIGDAGAAALAEALPSLPQLQKLGLYSNQIGDAGAAALAEALRSASQLAILYLQCNRIGREGAKAVRSAWRESGKEERGLNIDDQQGKRCDCAVL